MDTEFDRLSDPAKAIVNHLQMQKIPHEGPWFAESYRGDACSSIHTLLTAESFSALHRLTSDELWHFHAGAPLRLLLLPREGRARQVVVGADVLSGHHVQYTVEAGTWMGAKPCMESTHDWSLVGNVVTPAFDYDRYEAGQRDLLIARWPGWASRIRELTRA